MTAKEYLSQYWNLTEKLNELETDIERIEQEAGEVKLTLDGMPHGTDLSDKTGNYAAKLADMRMKAIEKRSEAWDKRIEIEDVIMRVTDSDYQRILYMRYILKAHWEEIAVDIHRSFRHVTRLHGEALLEVQKILDEK